MLEAILRQPPCEKEDTPSCRTLDEYTEAWISSLKEDTYKAIPPLVEELSRKGITGDREGEVRWGLVGAYREEIQSYFVLNNQYPYSRNQLLDLAETLQPFYADTDFLSLTRALSKKWTQEHACFLPNGQEANTYQEIFGGPASNGPLPYFVVAGLAGGGCDGEQIRAILTTYPFEGESFEYGIVMAVVAEQSKWPDDPLFRSRFLGKLNISDAHSQKIRDAVQKIWEVSYNKETAYVTLDFWNAARSLLWLSDSLPENELITWIEVELPKKQHFGLALLDLYQRGKKALPSADKKRLRKLKTRLEKVDKEGSGRKLARSYWKDPARTTYLGPFGF